MRLDFTDALVSVECTSCSITFAITATVERQLRETQRTFYCPNQHPLNYKGVLEIERLKAQITTLEGYIAQRDKWLDEKRDRIAALHRSVASLRGVITKMKAGGA